MQSQRWMFTSPGGEDEYKRPSITREHYDSVIELKVREKSSETENDRKKREFERLMWQQTTDKVLNQIKEKQQKAENTRMLSTYNEFYVKQGFELKELGTDIDKELEFKYPLYTDMAKSVHLREIHKSKANESIHKPLSNVFKRDTRFTSRLSNPFDTHTPVRPGHFAYV